MYNIERTHEDPYSPILKKKKEAIKERLMLEAEMYSLRAILEVSMNLREKALNCLEKAEKILQTS